MIATVVFKHGGKNDTENVHNGQESCGNPGVLPVIEGKEIRTGFMEV
jgi:hypothetical protein